MVMELVIIMIGSAVMFMVIENFEPHDNYPYDFTVSIYIIFVTILTVGYGDFMPATMYGRIFINLIIIYVIGYIVPNHSSEIIRLRGLKSQYARDSYRYNSEVPFIVITGTVIYQALFIFCEELFHEDHGTQDRHAVIL